MQEIVKEFNDKYTKPMSPENRMLDIQSEIGELCKEVLYSTDYGTKNFEASEDLGLELGDCLYSLLSFACENNIDAKSQLEKVIKKYTKRYEDKGHLGSN